MVFQAFNRYLGVGVGEHLGYLLTGAWSVLMGAALWQTAVVPTWLGDWKCTAARSQRWSNLSLLRGCYTKQNRNI